MLCASISACSHKLYHAIVTVQRNITALSKSPRLDAILRSKAASMLEKLGKYWNPFGEEVEMNKLVIVVGVFDPSKKMKITTKLFEKLYGEGSVQVTLLTKEIEDILRSLFDEYNKVLLLV